MILVRSGMCQSSRETLEIIAGGFEIDDLPDTTETKIVPDSSSSSMRLSQAVLFSKERPCRKPAIPFGSHADATYEASLPLVESQASLDSVACVPKCGVSMGNEFNRNGLQAGKRHPTEHRAILELLEGIERWPTNWQAGNLK